jgi:predicted nucleic acid-binding protein
MGLTNPLLYFDSCVVIYLVEGHPVFGPTIEGRLATMPAVEPSFSALSEMECLVMPLRNRNITLADTFRKWFRNDNYLPPTRAIFLQAAQLRTDHHGLKTPDALHLATALHYGCTEFWTNDDRLNKIAPGLSTNVCTP